MTDLEIIAAAYASDMDRATSAEKSIESTTCEIRVALAEMRVRVLKRLSQRWCRRSHVALAEMRVRVLKQSHPDLLDFDNAVALAEMRVRVLKHQPPL